MRGMINKLRKLRGISATPLKVSFNQFEGSGATLLTLSFLSKGSMCFSSLERCLFHIGISSDHPNRGHIVNLRMCIMFFPGFQIYSWILKHPLDRCVSCDDLCLTKDHYSNDTPYCSTDCKEFEEQFTDVYTEDNNGITVYKDIYSED